MWMRYRVPQWERWRSYVKSILFSGRVTVSAALPMIFGLLSVFRWPRFEACLARLGRMIWANRVSLSLTFVCAVRFNIGIRISEDCCHRSINLNPLGQRRER
jgi:hypothetical protein